MIFRNSMRSIFRTMGKSTLFTILIFALTLVLTLGVSVWSSISQFLNEADEYFTTIGLVEYMGADYPGDTANDPGMVTEMMTFDSSEIINDDTTLLWDESTRALGYIDGFWRNDEYMPNKMSSVLLVGNMSYKSNYGRYIGTIIDVKYSLNGRRNTVVSFEENTEWLFQRDHYYLVLCETNFTESNMVGPTNFENTIAASKRIKIRSIEDITSYSTDEPYVIPDNSVLMKVADTLQVTNNSVLISQTSNLMSMFPFHQNELYIVQGREFSEEEYSQGDQVAVISELASARLDIGVGDTIDLSIAVSDQPGVYNSYWVDTGFSYKETFEVVGIMNTVPDKSWYVYIPKSADVPSSPFPIGYTVGHAIISNDEAAEFNASIDPTLNGRLQLTIYDQGYSDVAIPFQTILSVAKIVTVVCMLVELAVLILFGFLFIYRQRETGQIMLALGAVKRQVIEYFLFSAGLIALLATTIGAITGYFLHDVIISLVTKAVGNYALIDSRFSNGNLSISQSLEFAPHLKLQFFLFIGFIIFALAVFACLGFVLGTFMNNKPSQQSQRGPKKERKTSHLNGGSWKYAILSVLRGSSRTLVVPTLATVVVLFFGQLATTSSHYQKQLNSIYNDTMITGNYTAFNGKQVGGLQINPDNISNFYRTGQIKSLTVSANRPYYYLGSSDPRYKTLDLPPLFNETGSAIYPPMEAEINNGANLTAVNDIHTSPEFLFSDKVVLSFLDGYDESFLSVPFGDGGVFNCIVPTSLMEEKGISLGDTIRVAITDIYLNTDYDTWTFKHYDLLVVGSFEKHGLEDTIYVPLSLLFDTSIIWGEEMDYSDITHKTFYSGFTLTDTIMGNRPLSRTFNSANFTLSNNHTLNSFKDYLTDYGYSQAQKISKLREFIVFKDASFNYSVASVKQQINYINTLYPFLYALVGIITIVVSYLMVVSRKMEFAIMRGLGTTRIRSFFSFFTEQSLLCLLGILIGFLIWLPAWGAPRLLHLALTTGFLICYLLGSAISVTIMSHTNVLTILTDKD